jgi:ATP-dependent Lon protease
MHIAKTFLLPKQLQANGLNVPHITLTELSLLHIATHYTHEAGVRSLERAIGAIIRYKAVEWAEVLNAQENAMAFAILPAGEESEDAKAVVLAKKEYEHVVEEHELERILEIARWDGEKGREARRGVIYGLVVMGQGEGGILPVETIAVPGSGHLKLMGSLGDVRVCCFPPCTTLLTHLDSTT